MAVELIIAVLGSGALSAVATAYFTRKRTQAEAEKITGESMAVRGGAWDKLIDQLQEELREVKSEIRDLRNENRDMHKQIAQLETEKLQMAAQIRHLEEQLGYYKAKVEGK